MNIIKKTAALTVLALSINTAFAAETPYIEHQTQGFLNALADFVQGVENGKPAQPNFRSALQTQKVCEAVIKSGKSGRWEKKA